MVVKFDLITPHDPSYLIGKNTRVIVYGINDDPVRAESVLVNVTTHVISTTKIERKEDV